MRKIITRASLPARIFEWNPKTKLRLAELLLEGNPLSWAIDLLGVEFGRVKRQEGVRFVLDAGGILPFILEQIPTLSREDFTRMQTLYHRHDGRRGQGFRLAIKDEIQRSALSRLASHDIYDEGVEDHFVRLIRAIRGEHCVVPHGFLIRGMSLLHEALGMKRAGTLVSCLTIRTEAPRGQDTNKKRQETHALFVARIMREIVELRTNPKTEFGEALAIKGFQKVILQVIEYTGERGRGFVAIESVLLDVVLRIE